MWLEAVRNTADWLAGTLKDHANVDQGVNVKLALVPADGSDTVPSGVTVFDETRDNAAAFERFESGSPALIVRLYREASFDGRIATIVRDGEIPITIGIAVNNIETKDGKAAESYLARALMWSLGEMHRDVNRSVLNRGSVLCRGMKELLAEPADGQLGKIVVSSAVRYTYLARDSKPYGT